jgi:hypothetical protein
LERAVELAPAHPPSVERARTLVALAAGLQLTWRHEESLAFCEQALELAPNPPPARPHQQVRLIGDS